MRAQTAHELFRRGVDSQERGDLAGAERAYKAAIAADASYGDAHHNLGVVYAQQQRWPEAEAAYRKAIELDPAAWQSLENLINLLVEVNRPVEAVDASQRLVAIADGERARALLGRAYIAAGKVAEGCGQLQKALDFNAANAARQLELAACEAQNSDFDAAVRHASTVVQRDPQNTVARELLQEIRHQQRAETWWWAPILLFFVALTPAIGARRPEQWGKRRVAFGLLAMSAATFLWLSAGSSFWLTGGFWGLYQFYAAFRFRQTRATRVGERAEYLRAAATVLGCVALADGELQAVELRLIRETYEKAGFTDQDLAVIGQTLQTCESEFTSKLFDHQTLYAALHRACIAFARISTEASRLELFRTVVRVTLADQHASPGELSVVKACATWLNVPESEQGAIWRELGSTQPQAD